MIGTTVAVADRGCKITKCVVLSVDRVQAEAKLDQLRNAWGA